MPYTLTFHRVLKAPPARVYKAFIDAQAMSKWLPPAGYTGTVHTHDPKVGGTSKMSFTEFDSGNSHSFFITYKEMVPGEKLVYVDKFDDPNMPGEMPVTVTLKKVMCGTDLVITQAGIPDAIPQEMCNLGWQDSLKQLEQFVEMLTAPGV
ncbi:SRPBCC family protein [Aestuariivirga litoralis]|uniref:SRPBCC family protein n=1 Tax=Aestuariivirga litoralis TaxID=2650924 RepID=UPI0018C75744|nr:SRPBCC family protein [Aestuariivirga litoralis]MBG1233456.1 SRPBCC family protein [Aestuariivirga litoralis]